MLWRPAVKARGSGQGRAGAPMWMGASSATFFLFTSLDYSRGHPQSGRLAPSNLAVAVIIFWPEHCFDLPSMGSTGLQVCGCLLGVYCLIQDNSRERPRESAEGNWTLVPKGIIDSNEVALEGKISEDCPRTRLWPWRSEHQSRCAAVNYLCNFEQAPFSLSLSLPTSKVKAVRLTLKVLPWSNSGIWCSSCLQFCYSLFWFSSVPVI